MYTIVVDYKDKDGNPQRVEGLCVNTDIVPWIKTSGKLNLTELKVKISTGKVVTLNKAILDKARILIGDAQ